MSMPPGIRLIATDLDGTLIGSANEFPLYASFKDRIEALRRDQQGYWVACTGRSRRSFNEFFYPMRAMGLTPDFIIIRHAYIFVRTGLGYMPRFFWNLHIYHLVIQQRLYAREVLRHWRDMIMGASIGVRVVDQKRDELRLRFDSDESAGVAGQLLRDKLESFKHLKVFIFQKEVEVRPVPFTKGLALSELARHIGIAPEHILAIGNGHNDISMFSPDVAGLTGCPANSETEVMEVVHARGGHIATARSLTGVMQILEAYRNGAVNSALPEWWVPNQESANPRHADRSRRSSHKSRRELKTASFWLVASIAYVTLIVLSYFSVVPFAEYVLKPFMLLSQAVTRIIEFLYRP